MESADNSHRGIFEGRWKSLCKHSTCEKLPVTSANDCYCITCVLGRDSDGGGDRLSQNGFRYGCFRRGLQTDRSVANSDPDGTQKAASCLVCPVEHQFFLMQRVLKELGLPSTVDRRDQARRPTRNDISIVYFSDLQEGWAPFFEGNRQSPGSFLLVMTTSWASREPSLDDRSLSSIMVNTAITADGGGQTYLDSYDPPRRATYVINHLNGSTSDGTRYEGEEFVDASVECPMASSLKLSRRTDNKLLTRMMMAACGVRHPVTLALVPQQDGVYDNIFESLANINVCTRPAGGVTSQWLEPLVASFLAQDSMKPYRKVVVKPFGPYWNCCKGVSFHDSRDVKSIIGAVHDLASCIDSSDGILVESFCSVFKPSGTPNGGRHAEHMKGKDLAFRIRAIASRTPQNGARMTEVFTGVANANAPFGGSHTIGISLEATLQRWGLSDPRRQGEIRESIKQAAERLLLTLIKQEEKLSAEERGGVLAQTDMIGMDIILSSINGLIIPVVIEVNAHDCLYASTVYESTNLEARGEATRTLMQTMIARSQRFLMKNKVVVVVGAGGYSQRNVLKDAQDFGVKIVLVDSDPEHFSRHQVHAFLYYDMTDHSRDREHADVIARRVKADVGHVDGCVTFWQDCVPLSALVAEALGLTHAPSYTAATAATAKSLTMRMLEGEYWPPHTPNTHLFASPAVRVMSPEDLSSAVKQVPLPAILKLEHGHSGVGVRHVTTLQEAKAFMVRTQNALRSDKDPQGTDLGHSRAMVLMSCLEGTEHHVHVVMFEGQVMAAFVSDRGPARLPCCSETTAAMPSVLSKEQERLLMVTAGACCRKADLVTGVFEVELVLTPCGPRLLEINVHVASTCTYSRDWIRSIYDVDLLHLSLMAACGVRPDAPNSLAQGYCSAQARKDCGQLMGILLYPSLFRQAPPSTATPRHLQKLHEQGLIVLRQMVENFEEARAGEFEKPVASLAVRAPTVEQARVKLVGLCTGLGLETEKNLRGLLQEFVLVQ